MKTFTEILGYIDNLKLNASQKLYMACYILDVDYKTDGSDMNQIVIYTGLSETESGTVVKL